MESEIRSEIRFFTTHFVRMLQKKGIPKADIANALGIGAVTLSKWTSEAPSTDVIPKKMNFIRLAVAASKLKRLKKDGSSSVMSSKALAASLFLPFGLIGMFVGSIVGSAFLDAMYVTDAEKWNSFEAEMQSMKETNTWDDILDTVKKYWKLPEEK